MHLLVAEEDPGPTGTPSLFLEFVVAVTGTLPLGGLWLHSS
jgi:hypothetical protein